MSFPELCFLGGVCCERIMCYFLLFFFQPSELFVQDVKKNSIFWEGNFPSSPFLLQCHSLTVSQTVTQAYKAFAS